MASYPRPTFTQILDSLQATLNTNLPGTDARLRRSVLNVLSYMLAGAVHGLYGFISYISVQVFPDSATSDYLNRWAAIFGVVRNPAAQAYGNVVFTGVDGTLIPAGSQLSRADQTIFATDADATIASGTITTVVTAVLAGANGNTAPNSTLTFVSPISGVDSNATVDTDGLTKGSDLQDDDGLRQALLNRIQKPPQGGAANDYVVWAKQVAGVTRAWCVPTGGGSPDVTVYFMMDNTYDDGIPLSGDVTTVQNYMNPLIPVTAILTVTAPTATAIDMTIHLIQNDTSGIRAAVEANLKAMIESNSSPGGTIYLSNIIETVNLTQGVFACNVTVPSGDVTIASDHIATMGTITWT